MQICDLSMNINENLVNTATCVLQPASLSPKGDRIRQVPLYVGTSVYIHYVGKVLPILANRIRERSHIWDYRGGVQEGTFAGALGCYQPQSEGELAGMESVQLMLQCSILKL